MQLEPLKQYDPRTELREAFGQFADARDAKDLDLAVKHLACGLEHLCFALASQYSVKLDDSEQVEAVA